MKILVTGVSEGIGGAICLRLARKAAHRKEPLHLIMTTSGRKPIPERLAEALKLDGIEQTWLTADLADPDAPAQLIAEALSGDEGLDALISNAGMMAPAQLKDLTLEQWDTTFNVNTRATWLLVKSALPALKKVGGSVVAISSMSGMRPHAGSGAYSSSKAALSMLCSQLAQELAADSIRVNAVAPGMIRTPLTEKIYQHEEVSAKRNAMVPMGRVGTPEDIADVVSFLVSSEAAYVTGQTILTDGGYCDTPLGLIPGLPKT